MTPVEASEKRGAEGYGKVRAAVAEQLLVYDERDRVGTNIESDELGAKNPMLVSKSYRTRRQKGR